MVGILLGYLTSYLFIDATGGWRYMFGLAAIPTVALGIGMVRRAYIQALTRLPDRAQCRWS